MEQGICHSWWSQSHRRVLWPRLLSSIHGVIYRNPSWDKCYGSFMTTRKWCWNLHGRLRRLREKIEVQDETSK